LDVEGGLAVGATYSGTTAAPANGAIIEGNVGIGTTATPSQKLYVSIPSTDLLTPVGLQIDNNYTGAIAKYGIDVNVDGGGSGAKYGISSSVIGLAGNASSNFGYQLSMTPNGTGSAFGILSNITNAGTGLRYGLWNTVSAAITNTSEVFGSFNRVFNSGSGTSYVLYGENNSTGAGTKYGLYMAGEDQNYFSGRVGIGTAAPARIIHALGAGTQYLRVSATGASASSGIELDGTGIFDWRIIPQLGVLNFLKGDVGGTMGSIYLMNEGFFNPGGGTSNPTPTLGNSGNRWGQLFTSVAPNVSSDYRLKKNIKNLSYGLKEIVALRPVSYVLKSDKQENTALGLIAQEVQKLIPEIVTTGDDDEKMLGMRYTELIPVLVKSTQELNAKIEALEKENKELKGTNTQLQTEVASLKTNQASEMDAVKKQLEEIKKVLGMEANGKKK